MYIFFPLTDREYRVEQLVQDYQTDIKYDVLTLNSLLVHEVKDVATFIRQRFTKKEHVILGIFVLCSEIVVSEESIDFINNLITFSSEDKTYRFLFVSELDLTHPDITKFFPAQTKLFNSINYYSLYDYKNSLSFLDHVAEEWNFVADKNMMEKIAERCGGHFMLLKEALRRHKLDSQQSIDDICNSETIKFRTEQIYFSLLPSERAVLKKIVMNGALDEDSNSEVHSARYLKKIGLIRDNIITIPVLETYIKNSLPRPNIGLSQNHIIVNNVIVDNNFSRKELKAFRLLLTRENHIVSREEIAESIWPIDTQSHYSEWAIDRIMSRLRDKIELIGLDKSILQTVRGKGYIVKV